MYWKYLGLALLFAVISALINDIFSLEVDTTTLGGFLYILSVSLFGIFIDKLLHTKRN